MCRLGECEQSGFNGQANAAWGPRQVRGDRSNYQIVRLPVGPTQSAFKEMKSGIGDDPLVSAPQTHLSLMCVFKGEVQSRITIISKERVKISLQIGAKIMKIG